ncbi:ABC transporter substrate-binding protein [Microaerobacter geothermalis]|uniref:ABC transporter substrate-binding protein n=1 Tax=Microaerobacter geothermalis TaxID=674972 RepID=UPI001F421BF2|nr:ABC transporter substrate-binding protein [Microaerobacter geothermalis]MCF6092665.1 ABC transporter substrate-binding protein [Microaerobacter geothermalis]
MKKVNFLVILSLLFVSLAIFVGCSSGKEQNQGAEKTKIRLFEVTRSIFYAPEYIALTQGLFEEEGLEVELTTAFGGDKTMTALLSDNADIILVGSETTIYVYNQGTSDPAINFAQLTQTDGSFLVSREPIEKFTWDMLKGKILLGQRKGGMPEMVSEFVQKKNGIIPFKDVEIIQNVDYANLGSAFASGTGDFVQLFEPVASKLELEGKGYVVASFGVESGKLPYTVFIAKKSFLDKKPDVVQSFTNAIYKAQIWAQSHSVEEIADAISPYFQEIDRTTMLKVVDRYKSQGSWATDPILDEEEYRNLEAVMESAGELNKKAPYNEIVNTTFAKNAMKNITQ